MSILRPLAAALALALLAAPSAAQQAPLDKESFLTPPKEIADAVNALSNNRPVSLTNLSPDGRKFLLTKSDALPPIERVGRHHVHLGGIALDPVACRSHDLWVRSAAGFDLFFPTENRTIPVQIPTKARVSNPTWSPDGSKLAYFAHFDDATHICVADTETGSSRRITTTPVLATLTTTFQWSRDGKRIQTVLLPDEGQREVPKAGVAEQPKVRVARPGANPSRVFRFLLESPYDMRLLEHLATGQLALVDVSDGKVTKIGFPSMIRTVSPAPGEGQFRVTTMKKPFSYYVPASNFGTMEGIWDAEGKNLYTLNDRNLRETEPTPPAPVVATAGAATPGTATPGTFGKGKGTRPTTPTTDPTADPTQPVTNPTTQPDPTRPDPTQPDPTDPDAPRPRFQAPVDPDGKRDLGWRPDGAGISFLQLEPAKTKDEKEPRKDRVMLWLPPFGKDDTKVVYTTPDRITSLSYSEDCQTLFLTQTVNSQRQITAVDLKDPKNTYIIHRSGGTTRATTTSTTPDVAPPPRPLGAKAGGEDDEQQPKGGGKGFGGGFAGGVGGATLMTKPGRGGVSVARVSTAGDVYVTGTERGGETGSAKPYIDKVAIKTGKKTRVFEAKGDMTETIDAVSGDDIKAVFTTRQKADVVPDSYMTDVATGKVTKLTNNVNPAPWASQLKTERFRVTRVDGFRFWVRVTTPAKSTGKLPALFWIYPREYTDQAAYDAGAGRAGGGLPGGVGGGRFTTPSVRSMTMLCLLGYAVVEPDVPIVGPAGRINDNYIHDLRNGLWAVIDDLDKKGIIDRDRLACGGHSYGAFSTANAMAHTPFFKAGIAGDGNYNRTLTSMAFQTERRQLWDARETYLEMSPLLWANRVNGALLMYHGMDDANVGTAPINAEHMFLALDGLGKPSALYMYPYEGHGPIAKETTMDLWARWCAWLDLYVKNPKKPGEPEKAKTEEKK